MAMSSMRQLFLIAVCQASWHAASALNCLNGGQKISLVNGGMICKCPEFAGYSGTECQHPAAHICAFGGLGSTNAFCTENGECRGFTVNSEHPGCNCEFGYFGEHCEFSDEADFQIARNANGYTTVGYGGLSALRGEPQTSRGSALGGGAIAGIIVGVAVAMAVAALVLLTMYRLRQNHTTNDAFKANQDYALDPDGSSFAEEGPVMIHKTQKESMLGKARNMLSRGDRSNAGYDDEQWDVTMDNASGYGNADQDYSHEDQMMHSEPYTDRPVLGAGYEDEEDDVPPVDYNANDDNDLDDNGSIEDYDKGLDGDGFPASPGTPGRDEDSSTLI